MNIKVSKLKSNPDNPRLIKDDKFKKLVNSLKEFPEMAEVRPIVVNQEMVVLGGNMRLKAMIEAGWKEAPVEIVDWSEEKQKEFVIKDNVGFGEWEWDDLANTWDAESLKEWGLDVWQPESVLDDFDETIEDKESNIKRAIMIEFDPKHYDKANELISQARKDGKNVGLIVLNAFSG